MLIMSAQTESIKVNDVSVEINDKKDTELKEEEKNVIPMDESLQKKTDIPLAPPVSFNFVGIRPTKLHEKNNQICSKLLGVPSIKIKFENLTLNDNVGKLKELIAEQFEIPKQRSILIMYGHIKLVKDDESLKNYGITDNSYFLLAIYDNINTNHQDIHIDHDENEEISRIEREQNRRQRDMDAAKRRLKRIQDLKKGIKPQSSSTKKQKTGNNIIDIVTLKHFLEKYKDIEIVQGLDIITQETDVKCMKLPICNHILTKNSLYQYCLSQFIDREQILKCPHTKCDNDGNNSLCGQTWDYPLIKQYLLSTKNGKDVKDEKDEKDEKQQDLELIEYGKLELLSARNVVEIKFDLQRCIDCKTLLYRNPGDNNFIVRIKCPLCPSTVFCWGCNQKWSDDHLCDTSFRAQTMEIISSCPLKKVGRVPNVPSIRACPKCQQLITHLSACKHMKCSFCKTNFCFICLKTMKNNKWQCGGYSDSCPVHKKQNYTLLPKLNQSSFQLF